MEPIGRFRGSIHQLDTVRWGGDRTDERATGSQAIPGVIRDNGIAGASE
jgi:hypothetical protein